MGGLSTAVWLQGWACLEEVKAGTAGVGAAARCHTVTDRYQSFCSSWFVIAIVRFKYEPRLSNSFLTSETIS